MRQPSAAALLGGGGDRAPSPPALGRPPADYLDEEKDHSKHEQQTSTAHFAKLLGDSTLRPESAHLDGRSNLYSEGLPSPVTAAPSLIGEGLASTKLPGRGTARYSVAENRRGQVEDIQDSQRGIKLATPPESPSVMMRAVDHSALPNTEVSATAVRGRESEAFVDSSNNHKFEGESTTWHQRHQVKPSGATFAVASGGGGSSTRVGLHHTGNDYSSILTAGNNGRVGSAEGDNSVTNLRSELQSLQDNLKALQAFIANRRGGGGGTGRGAATHSLSTGGGHYRSLMGENLSSLSATLGGSMTLQQRRSPRKKLATTSPPYSAHSGPGGAKQQSTIIEGSDTHHHTFKSDDVTTSAFPPTHLKGSSSLVTRREQDRELGGFWPPSATRTSALADNTKWPTTSSPLSRFAAETHRSQVNQAGLWLYPTSGTNSSSIAATALLGGGSGGGGHVTTEDDATSLAGASVGFQSQVLQLLTSLSDRISKIEGTREKAGKSGRQSQPQRIVDYSQISRLSSPVELGSSDSCCPAVNSPNGTLVGEAMMGSPCSSTNKRRTASSSTCRKNAFADTATNSSASPMKPRKRAAVVARPPMMKARPAEEESSPPLKPPPVKKKMLMSTAQAEDRFLRIAAESALVVYLRNFATTDGLLTKLATSSAACVAFLDEELRERCELAKREVEETVKRNAKLRAENKKLKLQVDRLAKCVDELHFGRPSECQGDGTTILIADLKEHIARKTAELKALQLQYSKLSRIKGLLTIDRDGTFDVIRPEKASSPDASVFLQALQSATTSAGTPSSIKTNAVTSPLSGASGGHRSTLDNNNRSRLLTSRAPTGPDFQPTGGRPCRAGQNTALEASYVDGISTAATPSTASQKLTPTDPTTTTLLLKPAGEVGNGESSLTFSVIPITNFSQYEPVSGDEIDEALAAFTNARANKILFTRVKQGVYIFGRLPVKLSLSLNRRLPIVTYKGVKSTLAKFVKLHEEPEFEYLDGKHRDYKNGLEVFTEDKNLSVQGALSSSHPHCQSEFSKYSQIDGGAKPPFLTEYNTQRSVSDRLGSIGGVRPAKKRMFESSDQRVGSRSDDALGGNSTNDAGGNWPPPPHPPPPPWIERDMYSSESMMMAPGNARAQHYDHSISSRLSEKSRRPEIELNPGMVAAAAAAGAAVVHRGKNSLIVEKAPPRLRDETCRFNMLSPSWNEHNGRVHGHPLSSSVAVLPPKM